MSNRVTQKMLDNLCDYLNKITGNPETTYTKGADGKLRANIGNYHIYWAYGGACLHQIQGEGGGVTCPLSQFCMPKRELWERMQAFIAGIEAGRS